MGIELRFLFRRMVTASHEIAVNLASLKTDDWRHWKWRFVPGLSGRVPHVRRVFDSPLVWILEIGRDAELTMHFKRIGVPVNSSEVVKKRKREARPSRPKARLRIIYKCFLEMSIRCVAPEPSGDLDGLRI